MPIPADGNWPSNVKAVILTPEEKQIMQAGNMPTVPGTITVQHVIKNPVPSAPEPEQQAQDQNLQEVIGRAAIITARKFNLAHVWRTDNKQPIAIADAEKLIPKNPGFVYFDFDQLEVLAAADTEVDSEPEPEPEPESEPEIPNTIEDSKAEIQLTPDIVDELAYSGMVVSPRMLPEQGLRTIDAPVPLPPQPALPVNQHMVTEREQRAWGGILTSPGQQVYVHPSGIIRVEVEGPIKLQKGVMGNTRVLRITRATPKASIAAIRTKPVTPVTAAKPAAQVTYRNQPTEKTPIPEPTKVEQFDESDF